MARLILVRHGESAKAYGRDADPGLSPLGTAQAESLAEALAPLGPVALLTSPMRRTQETAAPLAARWDVPVVIEQRVTEIQAPTDDLDGRQAWIARILPARWSDLDVGLQRWADAVVDFLLGVGSDAVIVSHFVAINIAIGRAIGDDRVMAMRLGNCSRTVIGTDDGVLSLLEPPTALAVTEVL
jgi:broad specificity phosphatase PhoE